jgi:PQQ-like domain
VKAYSIRCVLGVSAVLAMAAGCGGAQPQTNSLAPTQPDAKSAWPEQSAGEPDLLYVLRKAGSVNLYSYPEGKFERRLSEGANGLCADESGDVFIPEGNEIFEYAHGGTRPIAVLRNGPGGFIQSCAVDAVTGNLAVSGDAGARRGVAIYANAEGTPSSYAVGDRNAASWSSAYDNDGNLFVADAMRLLELPKGATRFKNIAWNGMRPGRLGPIRWDGTYLAAASGASGSNPATIFRYRVSDGRATLVGETALKGAESPVQFWIDAGGGTPAQVIKDARGAVAAAISRTLKPRGVSVVTYHYDNLRTGWDDNETSLSYQNVKNGAFGLLHTVTLDDQVSTQPLVVSHTSKGVSSSSKDDVAYVATESNTIYAVDAATGKVLFSRNLGNPVQTPLGCTANGPNVGIDGTPVIDLNANVMYVIAYTTSHALESHAPIYVLHELSLTDLSDAVTPVVVSASHSLTSGKTYKFDAAVERQRPALLEANGNIYAGFGSFCDYSGSLSRGWVLGWKAGSLTPLTANRLTDSLGKSPNDFFLSAIWMSGYGLAADPSGNVYFVTGNSDPSSYNGVTNIQESVVKVSSDLTKLVSLFTPRDVKQLDEGDTDFGSGGVLLLPSTTPYAVAAGKTGTMFLLDQAHLGGFDRHRNNVLAEEQIGGCWCGESYFAAAKDSLPRIVASGGNNVTIWKVKTSPTPKLILAGTSQGLPGGQDPGFFTTVSSAGSQSDAIIWAVARPQYVPGSITLMAFKSEPQGASSMLETLYQATAGYWAATQANANIVPVVANGKVYVASYQQLDIFGLGGSAPVEPGPMVASLIYRTTFSARNEVTGTLVEISGSSLALRTRTGRVVRVDDSDAVRHERSAVLIVGRPFNVRGAYDAAGVLHAAAIVRAKPSPGTWPPDR